MLAGQAFGAFVATRQYVLTANTSIVLPVMFAAFFAIWLIIGFVWLRERPTLEISTDGLFVSRIGSGRFFVRWPQIYSIEEFRRANVQTARTFRLFQIRWDGGNAKFNQYYTRLPRLIASLNAEIERNGISVFIHDFEPDTLRAAIGACSGKSERESLRRRGIVRRATSLESD